MTSLAGERRERLTRQVSSESVIVYGLFVAALVLLVASGITGWLEASKKAAAKPTIRQSLIQL